ncbi:MAG: pyridoxal phosphate-dependent aminotransferase [Rhodobacteraceae bacterium]|nr:pyridoxal phosphate-dependent aminotransferase [Paracoccaceae bacterium]
MNLSNRIENINAGGSDGWEVYYEARRLAAAGEPVLDLTIGDHDFRTAAPIIDAMNRSARGGNTGYSPVPGSVALRRAIAARIEHRTGVETSPESVLVTAGGQAALFATHLAILEAGATGLFCDPYYATFPGTIRATGATAVAVPTRPQNGFVPTAEDLRRYIDDTARSVLINSPNNPSGAVYDREALIEIGKVCKENDLWLISDEVYESQVWSGEHVSPRSIPELADRTLVIGSLSKSHAMTGFRCGWVAGPEAAISRLEDLATVSTYGVAGFVQDAAFRAVVQGDQIEARVANIYRQRLEVAMDCLSGANSVLIVPPKGAMYVLLDLSPTGLSGTEFARRLLEDRRIAVMPGESFGQATAGHVRVALTTGSACLKDALNNLVDFAGDLATRK